MQYNFPLRFAKIIISNLDEKHIFGKRFEEQVFAYMKQSGKNLRIVWTENANLGLLRNLLAFTSPLPKKGPIPIYLNALTKRTIKETVLQILKYPTNRWRWHIQSFFGNTVFSRGFRGRNTKGYNRELWRIILSYKRVWIAWVGVFYYGEYNTYLSVGEFIRSYFKNFSFLLIWDKNFGSHTGWPVAKPLWIHPWMMVLSNTNVLTDQKDLWDRFKNQPF